MSSSFIPSGGVSCPAPMTRAALLALRASNSLITSCPYIITDHVQGRLVAGTTITMRAVSANELSENVDVNTTYDNEAWSGIYDIDRALVLELKDNRNNIARGLNGTEVSNFDWGNTSYTNVTVDNATLTVNIGNTAPKQNLTIEKTAIVNITNFTGNLNNMVFSTAVTSDFTGANGTWRLSSIKGGSSFSVAGYTGGGDNYYNDISGSSIVNFSNSSSIVTFRQNEVSGGASITHSGVSTGSFTLNTSKVMSSNIIHAVGAGNFSATGNNQFLSGATVNHQTGAMNLTNVHNYSGTIQQGTNAGAVMSLNQVHLKQGPSISNQATGTLSMTQSNVEYSSVQRQANATGTLTVNFSNIAGSSNIAHTGTNTANSTISYANLHGSSQIINNSAATITVNRAYIEGNSNITTSNGSAGSVSVSDLKLLGQSAVSKFAASTVGALNVTISKIENGSFVQTAGTGNLTVTQSSLEGTSGVNVTSGDRNYNFTRLKQTGVARANLSGTGAAITDTHNELEMHYRGAYNNSATGAANSVLCTEVTGTSGVLTLAGTTGGSSLNRIKIYDGTFNKTNNPNAGTYQLWTIRDACIATITNHAANEQINYIDVSAGSVFTINRTGAGRIQYVQVRDSGTAIIQGTSTTINKLDVEQGVFIINAGSLANVSKKMSSTFTVNAGVQTNVHHWNTVSKTATAANTNRVDYLGVVSSVPIV